MRIISFLSILAVASGISFGRKGNLYRYLLLPQGISFGRKSTTDHSVRIISFLSNLCLEHGAGHETLAVPQAVPSRRKSTTDHSSLSFFGNILLCAPCCCIVHERSTRVSSFSSTARRARGQGVTLHLGCDHLCCEHEEATIQQKIRHGVANTVPGLLAAPGYLQLWMCNAMVGSMTTDDV